jgi:hypothetical protein
VIVAEDCGLGAGPSVERDVVRDSFGRCGQKDLRPKILFSG